MTTRSVELRGRLGVYLDRPAIQIPEGGLADARNCVLRQGQIVREGMGWESFEDLQLNGPVLLIDGWSTRNGTQLTVFGTDTDLYSFNGGTGLPTFITPRYATGSVLVTLNSPNVQGAGTSWLTTVKAGDAFHAGSATQNDPLAVWYTVQSVTNNTNLVLTSNYLQATVVGAFYTIRQRFTGTQLNPWSTAVYYDAAASGIDYWYATNGVEVPVRWNPNDTAATQLNALGFTCKFLSVFGNMMIYGNLVTAGDPRSNVFRNSAIGDPENVSTLEATEINGTDIADTLVNAVPMADLVVMYGHKSLSIAQFVGPPLYWVVRTISRHRGALSTRAIVDRGEFHSFLTMDGAYTFDGVRTAEFCGQVFREAVKSLDLARLPQAIGFRDIESATVTWVYPTTQDGSYPVTAYVEQYQENVGQMATPVMIRDLPATALGFHSRTTALRFSDLPVPFETEHRAWNDKFFSGSFPVKLMGMADGTIMELGVSDTNDGVSFKSFARFRRIPLVDGISNGLVQEAEAVVKENATATYPVDLLFYTADRSEATPSLEATIHADLTGSGPRWQRPRILSRFLDVQIQTEGTAVPFVLSGVRLQTRDGGRR